MTARVRRIAILGAESTGKSTLAAALARRYGTVWVPEYLREFVEINERVPFEDDQVDIAATQLAWENAAVDQAKDFLFCDTTPFMTALYSRFYWGRVDPRIDAIVKAGYAGRYEASFVTAPDAPWQPDGLQRESEQVRATIHRMLLDALDGNAVPFILLSRSLEERLQQAGQVLDRLVRAE